MGRQTIESKVNRLEERVGDLEKLPDRVGAVESQIVQLRSEMHDEFSAVRTEMRDEFAAVRREMKHEFAAVRSEMASEFGDVRAEIRAGEGETRRYMRVLHEEVIGRIAAIQEGQPPGSQASRAASNFTANAYLEVRRTGPSSA